MSDPTAQEPTMEEILASIRWIISEDDAPASEAPVAEAAPSAPAPEHREAPAPAAAPAPPRLAAVPPSPAPVMEKEDEDDEVLDLTEPAPAPKETHGDLDVFDAPPLPKAPEPKPKPEPIKAPPVVEPFPAPSFGALDEERLISDGTEDKAASHFGKLSQSIAMPSGGRTLEDLVSELLKPLLKDWLDEHLPAIVEEKVQFEVERISRRRP